MADITDIRRKIYDKLLGEGFTHNAAMGIIANFSYETVGFTTLEEMAENVHGTKGLGVAQWTDSPTNDRRTQYEQWMKENGKSLDNILDQIDYFIYELENKPNNMPIGRKMNKGALNKAKSIEEAADFFMKGFEAPHDQSSDHLRKRLEHIKDFTIDEGGSKEIPSTEEVERDAIKVKDIIPEERKIDLNSIRNQADSSLSTLSIDDEDELGKAIRRVIDKESKFDTQYVKVAKALYNNAVDTNTVEYEEPVEPVVQEADPIGTSQLKPEETPFALGGNLQPNGRRSSFKRPEDLTAQDNTLKK